MGSPGIGSTILEIALVVVLDEGMWNADRCAAITNTVGELVPWSRLMLAGQSHVIVGSINVDMVLKVFQTVPSKLRNRLCRQLRA